MIVLDEMVDRVWEWSTLKTTPIKKDEKRILEKNEIGILCGMIRGEFWCISEVGFGK
jgi:hypothetical protein